MNCYEHNTKAAIGQCACCFKALCKDCVSLKDHILACKNKRCKTVISENTEILLRTKRM